VRGIEVSLNEDEETTKTAWLGGMEPVEFWIHRGAPQGGRRLGTSHDEHFKRGVPAASIPLVCHIDTPCI